MKSGRKRSVGLDARNGGAYRSAVLPAPLGPQISVTLPRSNPPPRMASRLGRPDETHFERELCKPCSAWVAETVGSRSTRKVSEISQGDWRDVREDDGGVAAGGEEVRSITDASAITEARRVDLRARVVTLRV